MPAASRRGLELRALVLEQAGKLSLELEPGPLRDEVVRELLDLADSIEELDELVQARVNPPEPSPSSSVDEPEAG